MCRMLIASGNFDPNPIIDGILQMAKDQNIIHELNEKKGLGSWKHGDGWGAAYINKGGKWTVVKSLKPIYEDSKINELRNIKTNLLILHARYRMGSKVSEHNTHPFVHKRKKKETLIFCHNGFIEEEIDYEPKYKVKGDTDSEKLFYSILTDLKKNKLDKAIRKNFKKYKKISGTNIILSTKDKAVIAIRNNRFPEYYKMQIGKNDNFVVVSSEKLKTLPKLSWKPLDQGDIVSLDHKTLEISIKKEHKKIFERIISMFKKANTYKTEKLPDKYLEMIMKGEQNAS